MELIPLIIIALSFSGILYIFFRKVKAVSKVKRENLIYPKVESKEPIVVESIIPSEIGGESIFIRFMEKFFRRMRVRLMKVENWLASIANKLHERGARKKNFFEQEEGSKKISNDEKNTASFVSLNTKDEKFDEDYWINILKHQPNSAYPYKKLGEIYTTREDFSEARSVLKYALKLDPSDEETKGMFEGLKGKRTKRKSQSA